MNILKRLQIHALLIALSLFVPFSSGAMAQENTGSGASTTLPEALGPEAMQSLVSKLDSEQTEALAGLLTLLNESIGDEIAGSAAPERGALELIQSWMTGFVDAAITHTIQLPSAVGDMASSIGAIFSGKTGSESLLFLAFLALSIAVGIGVEMLFQRSTAARRERIQNERPDTLLGH